ncbi:hypothetical protein BOTBODRAFT_171929 [Botryobasidium botryosum FD-172 SS1]|uniref:RING-type domain-containing protein n=1 Tax=Botryobasidium botryosum (strain FD-172 SS1) TaxID=930990 RepID=A0A067MUA4_BOTB1|nr:hypothetical protein BOTBODRAFT_171929 [Botryobasidium botryosum FD-172 SS1]
MPTLSNSHMHNNPAHGAAKRNQSTQSLNHLLNFSLPPRVQPPLSTPRRSRRGAQPVFNKEKFVNAQYRFVMKPTGDYTVHFADPDIFFQWQDILQVIIPRSSALASASEAAGHNDARGGAVREGHTTCPICLSPPTAPRMTKCGHVFCFPCILHYLQTGENPKWNRCPICFDSITDKQLKSVTWFDGRAPTSEFEETTVPGATLEERVAAAASGSDVDLDVEGPAPGSFLRMRLMRRPQITTLALPRSLTWPSDLIPPHQAPFHFLPDVFPFAKFMLATPAFLIAALTRDLDELEIERKTLVGMGDELSATFVEAAEVKVRRQIEKAAALESDALNEAVEKAQAWMTSIGDQADKREREAKLVSKRAREQDTQLTMAAQDEDIPMEFLSLQSQSGGSGSTPTTTPSTPAPTRTPPHATPAPALRGPKPKRNINPPPPSTSTYFYYQAVSGALIFLHPLDIRILLSHFHSYDAFPDAITVRVEHASEGTISDDLRKRCKYLAHLSEATDVVFIEADLEGVVGWEGIAPFEGAVKMRRSKRREKGKKDEKARVRAELKEREKMAEGARWEGGTRLTPPWSEARAASPVDIAHLGWEAGAGAGAGEEVPVTPAPAVTGAWGSRSFATALHSAPPPSAGASQRRTAAEDDWEVDQAWQELEEAQASAGGRRKKGRSKKLVLLGGGGGGRSTR